MTMSVFRQPEIMVQCLITSGLAVLAGIVLIPRLLAAGAAATGIQVAAWAGAILACGLGMLALLSWAVRSVQGEDKRVEPRQAVTSGLAGLSLLAAIAIALGLVTGAIALAVYSLARSLPIEILRRGIDLLSLTVALVSAPLLIAILLIALAGTNAWTKPAWQKALGLYEPLAIVTTVASVLGFAIWAVTHMWTGILAIITQCVLLTSVSTIALYLSIAICLNGNGMSGRVINRYRPRHAIRTWTWPHLPQAARRGAIAGVAVAASLAVVMGMIPTQVAQADPADSPTTVESATPQSEGQPTNTVPTDETGIAQPLRDPQIHYGGFD